jgi:ferritin-like metal-binding protein YciE
MDNLHDLFIEELKDLYSAETQITKALPKMMSAASHTDLKLAFEKHLEQTTEHIERLEEIGKELNISLSGKKCKGMAGLIEEGESMLEELDDANVMDAALIASAQKVEHYEIAGYGTAATFAKLMKHKNVLKLLKKTIGEEEDTDKKLTKIATSKINKLANTEKAM